MDTREHWENVYAARRPDEVSWYQKDPGVSLSLISATGCGRDARILDVGGGASVLVDRLVDAGFPNVTVLDIAENALAESRRRMGSAGHGVEWLAADVLGFEPATTFDVWHDRAVRHFLLDPADRVRYRESVYRAVRPGGHIIISSFGPDGPLRCSGLDIVRSSAEDIAKELGSGVRLMEHRVEDHVTPSGAVQQFVYARFLRETADYLPMPS